MTPARVCLHLPIVLSDHCPHRSILSLGINPAMIFSSPSPCQQTAAIDRRSQNMGQHASWEISRETDEVDLGDRDGVKKRWGEAPGGKFDRGCLSNEFWG